MKVLLTGASGFIGGHILSALIKKIGGDSVVALTSKAIPSVNCLLYGSFKDFNLSRNCFDDVTHVIHAGAFIPKNAQQANNINSCFESIEYTKNLLLYNFHKIERFINISTVDVYATKNGKLLESSEINPVSLYGTSKVYCEKMVKAFSKQKNASYINLRIGHVYGPGEEKYKKVIPIAIQNIIKDIPLEIWGEGEDLRSFIFIRDVVESILNSLESPEEDIDINIVSGEAISIRDLLYKVIRVSEKDVKVDRRESNHEKRDLVFDNTLLLKTLLNKETDLMHGLKLEYQYMKAKHENNI
jgi:nucleoside-diphosphate-sugar epimerase